MGDEDGNHHAGDDKPIHRRRMLAHGPEPRLSMLRDHADAGGCGWQVETTEQRKAVSELVGAEAERVELERLLAQRAALLGK